MNTVLNQHTIIETPRLHLRVLTPEVYEEVFTSMSDEEIKNFFGCRSDKELEEERKKYEQGLSMYRKSFLVLQMLEKQSGEVIGWCGYHTWYILHHRAEIGYLLNEDKWKQQGFMKEALPYVINFGFRQMGLKRIEALVGPFNVPSLKLIESLGFVLEGTLREHYLVNGRYEDSLFYALLEKEWKG